MMGIPNRFILPILMVLIGAAACTESTENERFCFENGICVEPDGTKVTADGRPICELDDSCDEPDPDPINGNPSNPVPDPNTREVECDCTATVTDNDGDCIEDSLEESGGSSTAGVWDTDGDGIGDGCEDVNHNGQVDELDGVVLESDPNNQDSDSDGLADGLEDANKNGILESDETNPIRADTDRDGIDDGVEDRNQNGQVDAFVDTNGDGCFDEGTDTPGELNPRLIDSDGDRVPDYLEDANKDGSWSDGETNGWSADTDCDGLSDGREDVDQNGILNSTETDPTRGDTDGDGLLDGVEDANDNGVWDEGLETHPLWADTDGDQIPDGVEDANYNGVVDAFVDANENGCWEEGEQAGESDPRLRDSDADGIPDDIEDSNKDGECLRAIRPDILQPQASSLSLVESCAFTADSDCDGINDGVEDANLNGERDLGELDPLRPDTDLDGLTDGCGPLAAPPFCEDLNNNGIYDSATETNPLVSDTDGDGLTDGCEVRFNGCEGNDCGINPRVGDTDGDGFSDGEEDQNRNCLYEPDAPQSETDPRVSDPPPSLGGEQWPQWSVCGWQNQRPFLQVTSSRSTHDYRYILDMEQVELGESCTLASECNAQEGETLRCVDGECIRDVPYHLQPFGRDTNQNGFNPNEEVDELWGHLFQSPKSVDQEPTDQRILNRDVYGFLFVKEDTASLDDALDSLRNAMREAFESVTEVAALTTRPAHDDLPAAPVFQAQRQLRIKLAGPSSALALRNEILTTHLLNGETPDPEDTPPSIDPVYGNIICATSFRCYRDFTVYISGAKRLNQRGPNGQPVVLIAVALTPNDSSLGNEEFRLYDDRLLTLEDLTGGSSLARFDAELSATCENKAPTKALADILWVVDDSRSMQQIIGRLQKAATEAQAILRSNSEIVDFRLATSTTNPAATGRTQCVSGCDSMCQAIGNFPQGTCDSSCADQTIGCLELGGDSLETVLANELATGFALPGGGGSFYYEDSFYLDCDSRGYHQQLYITSCAGEPGFTNFFADGGARKVFPEHGGFFGTDVNASCDTSPMDLSYFIQDGQVACANAEDCYCERLIESCTDGPTLMVSQMCDLIRSMGGLPSVAEGTSSARPHSASEHGIRSARRLMEKMVPALPYDWTSSDPGGYNPHHHLRLSCSKNDVGCQPCDPDTEGCDPVPLLTVFLSDEEDFWFKDDCERDAQNADLTQLPSSCLWVDGDSSTSESCTVEYCDAAGFDTDPATGFAPDSYSTNDDVNFTQTWKHPSAPQCSNDPADRDTTCVADPCLDSSPTDCAAWNTSDRTICEWTSGGICENKCAGYSNEESCSEDTDCRWEQAYDEFGAQIKPCVVAQPINDCRACKRLRRLNEALDGDAELPTGLGEYGPVYAMVRNKGEAGFGETGSLIQDECEGGLISWGRGDGQAYRDLAIQTYGRTQDVCADGYLDFMQTLAADIAVLSAPYKLEKPPLGSTLRVGIARPNNSGGFDFVEVPRSRAQGFFYSVTTRSIGFKSDPVDGECGGQTCSEDGVIESSEIDHAQGASHIPRDGDLVFVSYRYWRPVPCADECSDDETCVRVLCEEYDNPGSCGPSDAGCPAGYTCEGSTCSLDCIPGSLIDACVRHSYCEPCSEVNAQGECISIDDSCQCAPPGEVICSPDAQNACPIGFSCSNECLCGEIGTCDGGFSLTSEVPACEPAVACCDQWDSEALQCGAHDGVGACIGDSNCEWEDSESCDFGYETCCQKGETLQCGENEATGELEVYCAPTCLCDPACGVEEYCCVECGCVCLENSP